MFILPKKNWYLTRIIFLIAGIFILTSVLLGIFINERFFIFTGFIGAMQIIFSLTGFCPMAIVLNKYGIKCNL